jgi:hypothetical protein
MQTTPREFRAAFDVLKEGKAGEAAGSGGGGLFGYGQPARPHALLLLLLRCVLLRRTRSAWTTGRQ